MEESQVSSRDPLFLLRLIIVEMSLEISGYLQLVDQFAWKPFAEKKKGHTRPGLDRFLPMSQILFSKFEVFLNNNYTNINLLKL